MKKVFSFILSIIVIILITGCSNKEIELIDNYEQAFSGTLDINKDEVKIMQLTDLHLTYGFDALDRKTYKLIEKMVKLESPDLIVITGDVFMSVYAKRILKSFIKFMESLKTPWAYTFGNHEGEYHRMEELVNILMKAKTNYLYFHYGPKLSDDYTHGYSNYKLTITNKSKELLNIYLLDTKAMRTDGIKDGDNPYDYLSAAQVQWVASELLTDTANSLAFMHIPLIQYENYENPVERVWAQGLDTGFFDLIKNSNKTLGVFAGHDHLNNHEFYYEGILLAYGVSSGFNAYGDNNLKGSRIIIYNYQTETLQTYKIFTDEVLK